MKKQKPTQAEFVKWFIPVVDALKSMGGSGKPKEIYRWIETKLNLPESVIKERYEVSGQYKYRNQVAWARQYLIWEGILDSSQYGIWALTKKGSQINLTEEDAGKIFQKWGKTFRELRESKNEKGEQEKENEGLKIQDIIESDSESTPTNPSLLDILQKVTPEGFELLCGRLLRAHGFDGVNVTQRTRDGGIDGYGVLQLNPFVSLSVSFQCKRYKGAVPSKDVQAFIGAMESSDIRFEKGIFITTGYFSADAERVGNSNHKLELIDGESLVLMFEKASLGLKAKTIFEVDMAYFKDFMEK